MQMAKQIAGKDVTLAISGNICEMDLVAFSDAINEIKLSDCRQCTIDMKRATYLSSSGIGALLYAARVLGSYNKGMKILASGSIELIIRESGLDKVLSLHT